MIKDKITGPQLSVTIISVMVGVGILSFPSTIAQTAGVDGWIGILIAGGITLTSTLLITLLGSKFQYQSLYDYGPKLVGRIFHFFFMVLFIGYFLFFISIVVRIAADVTKIFLLDETPVEIILVAILTVCTYLVVQGINPIARFNESLQPGVILILLFVILLSFKDADFGRNLPILGDGILPVMKSIPIIFFAFLGFEVLFFLLPFLKETKKVKKYVSISIISVTLFYAFIMVITIAVFGQKEVEYLQYPTIALVKNIEVPGTFIERLESIMMFVWIPFALTTIVILNYGASVITMNMLKLEEHRAVSLAFFPFTFITAVLPIDSLQVSKFAEYISYLGVFLSIGLPLLLWGMYGIKKGLKLL
ncbi:spore germination protein [Bacillus timonensis]|nr:spore germination protein [Bacillus timonensis]